MRYTIHRDGQTYGPYTLEEVHDYQKAGSILGTDQAQAEGADKRVPVSSLTVAAGPPPIPNSKPKQETDATGGVIPYKNVPALTAYYLAVFSLIPGLGFFLGTAAFVLGIIGFNKYRRNPAIRGQVHAWIGIIVGGVIALGHVAVIAMLIAG